MAAGVDDRIWPDHLRAGEYSRWLRDAIKGDDLASEPSTVGSGVPLSARDSACG